MNLFDFKTNNFDLIRLLAALQVVIVHSYEHFGVRQGELFITLLSVFPGVPIFFVISGFLIAGSLERSQTLASYFENRFLRIYPALWACFLFSIATVLAVSAINTSWLDFTVWSIAQLTVGQFFNPDFLRTYGVGVLNGSLWTIPVEIQFYLLLPLLYFVLNKVKYKKQLLAVLIVLLVLPNQVFVDLSSSSDNLAIRLLGVTVIPYLYIFLLGVILQKNLKFVEKYLANKSYIWLGGFLIIIFASYKLGFNYKGNYLNPLAALALGCLTISVAYSQTTKFNNILSGYDISYGVYIYHMVVINLLIHMQKYTPVTNMLVTLLCTILLALGSWVFVEKPALSFKRYTIKKHNAVNRD